MSNPPDQPPVPQPQLSKVVVVYAALATVALGLWVYAGTTGWVPVRSSKRESVPAGIRSSPGGYRSFHFWHSGFHGGK